MPIKPELLDQFAQAKEGIFPKSPSQDFDKGSIVFGLIEHACPTAERKRDYFKMIETIIANADRFIADEHDAPKEAYKKAKQEFLQKLQEKASSAGKEDSSLQTLLAAEARLINRNILIFSGVNYFWDQDIFDLVAEILENETDLLMAFIVQKYGRGIDPPSPKKN